MSDETPQIPSIEDITARLEQLPELDSAGLAQLDADIRARYETDRNPDDGIVDLDHLETLQQNLGNVTDRRAEVAAEEAQAAARLAELDAVMAGEAVELSAEDAAAFDGWSDDELAAVAELSSDEFAALAALNVTEEPTPETETVEEVPQVDEPDLRAASARPRTVRLPSQPRQPQPADLTATSPVATIARTGTDVFDDDAVFHELQSAVTKLAGNSGRARVGQEIPVASIHVQVPDNARMRDDENAEAFYARQLGGLRQARGQDPGQTTTRQAAGTFCAPVLTDYAVPVIGSEAQPVGGIFPSASGGTADQMKTLNFVQAMTFSDFTDVTTDTTWGTAGPGATSDTVGIGSATATQNALPVDNASSPYPKLAMEANCPTFVTCEQRATWLEIKYDNLGSMAWPEFVAAVRRGGDIALANYMDALRLQDWFDSAEAAGNDLGQIAQGVNANHNYLRSILNIVMTDRSNKRDWDTPYVVTQPAFLDGLLAVEQLGTAAIATGTRAITEARDQIARDYNISFVNYLGRFGVTSDAYLTDGGYDTILPALPDDGATPEMPCQVRVGIARDDAGFNRIGDTLNLGVLRTETDLANNFWRTFWESWQRLCFRIPPIVADINVNPNMLVMGYDHVPAGTNIDFCAGSGS